MSDPEDTSELPSSDPSASNARKRRIALRKQANTSKKIALDDFILTEMSEFSQNSSSKQKQQRVVPKYDPEVPMSKEQAANWRREARRVRNRQSAAASRQKTRTKIAELESLSRYWEGKYQDLKLRLMTYESEHNVKLNLGQEEDAGARAAMELSGVAAAVAMASNEIKTVDCSNADTNDDGNDDSNDAASTNTTGDDKYHGGDEEVEVVIEAL